MNPREVEALLDAADREYTEAQEAANKKKNALLAAWTTAVQAGISPDAIAERLKASKTPEQIEAGLTFTAAYIRRQARSRGAAPLRGGPKPRQGTG